MSNETQIKALLYAKKNLGNYENVMVGFEITDVVRDTDVNEEGKPSAKVAAKRIYSLVEALIQDELDGYSK